MQAFDDHPMRAFAALLLALCLGSACAGPTGPEATAKARETRRSGSGGAASEEDVRRARSHHSMGVNHLQDGRVALAIRELRAADQLNPADGWIQLGLAEAYRQKGLLDDSERHLLKGLAYNPDFAELRLTLSALYIQQERFQESLAMSAALVDDPTFPAPWTALTNKGFAEIQLGLLSEARKSLELAVEYHDQYWRAQLNLGILEAMQGGRMEAVDRFEQVIALEPGPLGEAEAYYRTAEIYISLGDRDRAVHQLEAAVSRRPSGSWGKLSEDYLKRLR